MVYDDPTIIEGFSIYFTTSDDLELVGAATSGLEAIDWLEGHSCDVILSDIHMPDINGIELLQHIQECANPPVFIAMTAYDTDQTMLQCLSLGAAGYIVKGQSPQEIISAIYAAVKGGTSLSAECASRVIKSTVLHNPQFTCPIHLSREEREIIAGIQRGLTNRQIAKEMNYAEITIKKKVSRLLERYGFSGRAELAKHCFP